MLAREAGEQNAFFYGRIREPSIAVMVGRDLWRPLIQHLACRRIERLSLMLDHISTGFLRVLEAPQAWGFPPALSMAPSWPYFSHLTFGSYCPLLPVCNLQLLLFTPCITTITAWCIICFYLQSGHAAGFCSAWCTPCSFQQGCCADRGGAGGGGYSAPLQSLALLEAAGGLLRSPVLEVLPFSVLTFPLGKYLLIEAEESCRGGCIPVVPLSANVLWWLCIFHGAFSRCLGSELKYISHRKSSAISVGTLAAEAWDLYFQNSAG